MPTSRHAKADSRTNAIGEAPTWRYEVALTDGLLGVNRIVTLLRQRNYKVMWMRADFVSAIGARRIDSVTVVVAGTEHEAALLEHRVLRLPFVLNVDRQRAAGLHAQRDAESVA